MKKTLSILALVVLVAAVSVLGTLAYLTSTDTVTNTFTVGKVAITLDEAKVSLYGQPVDASGNNIVILKDAPRVKSNTYKLVPGHSYTKDPTVTVLQGSEASYIRLLVTVRFDKALTDETLATELDGIFSGYKSTEWDRANKTVAEDNKSIVYEYRYKGTVDGGTGNPGAQLPALFTGFKVPDDWTAEKLDALDGFKIEVVAQAIQALGFNNPDEAWAAFATNDN